MRKRTLLVVLAGVVVVVLLGCTGHFLLSPSGQATHDNFARLESGMSLAEVESILGPSGDQTTGPAFKVLRGRLDEWPPPGTTVVEWESDDSWITVAFDVSGREVAAVYSRMARNQQGPLDNLLWRAKRQWHRWFLE
jgi:hypothetical protein